MRWTRTLIPTLREAPSDAECPSYRLMMRAGLVRPLGSSSYAYLPLGTRVLRKAEDIVRQEMSRTGAFELSMPSLHSAELWRESGCMALLGEVLFRVKDRRGAESVLGPGLEEAVTHVLRSELRSYRQLPAMFFQIGIGYRNEARPHKGVLGARESLRMDAISFDADERGLAKSYQAVHDACLRAYTRAGLRVTPVETDAESDDGEGSRAFMADSAYGEDDSFACGKCSYAASRGRAECPPFRNGSTAEDTRQILPIQEVATPGAHTIDQVSDVLQVPPRQLIKTLIYRTDSGYLAALVRGDHDVNEAKLRRAARSEQLELASPEEVERQTGGPVGYSGPIGLKLPMIADHCAVQVCNGVTGANKADTHYANVNVNRDFRPEAVVDIRSASLGDPCPRCRAPLCFHRGIEVGHALRLGSRSIRRMNCVYLDNKGQLQPMLMGRYGIAVCRVVAAVIERHHDDRGIVWPRELAPYQVEILSLDHQKLQIVETAHNLYEELSKAGLEVLWDDRESAPGVKFADADLIGLPVRIIVGKRTLEAGTVDVKTRRGIDQKTVLIERVLDMVNHELSACAD